MARFLKKHDLLPLNLNCEMKPVRKYKYKSGAMIFRLYLLFVYHYFDYLLVRLPISMY